jgi:RNA polymerase sigma-70 factor, ECF subfamily
MIAAATSAPGSQAISDDDLMVRVAEGDASAFEAIYRRHQRQAFRQAVRILGHTSAAEDVMQDAFLSLWQAAWRYDPNRGRLTPWLLMLVRNRAIDRIRREAQHERALTLVDAVTDRLEATDRTDEQVERRDQSRHLQQLLSELPREQHKVARLAYFTGLSHTEIASKCELPLGTVKGRQRLALAKLRRALANEQLGV